MPRAFGETTWQQGSKPMDGLLEIVLCKSIQVHIPTLLGGGGAHFSSSSLRAGGGGF